jgi:hypothetical protein
MFSRKGMESIEVWMWLIAGLVIGSLIFVSGYTLLSHWVSTNERTLAQKSFSSLKDSVLNVCSVGTDRQEIASFVFPRMVNNLSVANKSDSTYGWGNYLCMDTADAGEYCEQLNKEPNNCFIPMKMDTLSLVKKTSLFYVIQKALGEAKSAKIKFMITKSGRSNISINWTEDFLE